MSRIAWMLSGLLWLCAAPALAGVPETPRFRLVGVAEGLPSSSINAVARDRAGYLWLATPDGLARYDGIGFRIWRSAPGAADALPGNNIQALHVDARDRVWVATEAGGLSVLDPQRRHFRHYRQADYPAIGSDDTWALASRDGALWFGTYGGGLHRLDADGRITRYMPEAGNPRSLPADTVLALLFDAQGTLWVGTTQGVARWTGKDFERIALPGAQPAPLVFSLTRDGDAIWVGAGSGVWRRSRDGRWVAPSWSPMFERPNAMMVLARDRDGQFWIGSQRGLWRTRADGVPVPVHDNGPGMSKAVASLLLQDDGALWAPIPGVGLGYLRADWRQLAQFARSDGGLSGSLYRGIAPARRGGVWLANYAGAPERLAADGSVEHLPPATVEALQGSKFMAIVEDPRGGLWAGERSGLVRIDGDGRVRRWRPDDAEEPVFPGLDLLRLGADGSLWLSCNGSGVQQRDGRSGKLLRSLPAGSHGLGNADIEALELAADGSVWIAGDGGVARWHPGRERFEPQPALGSGRVYAMAFDGADVLWLSRLTGLEQYRRVRGAWRRVAGAGPEAGIPAVEAAGMRIDRSHRVWLSTTRGLFRWDPETRRVRRFGVQDGLSSQEFETHSITLTDTGVLAATTTDGGVVLVDTTAPDPAPARPELRIDEVAVRRAGRWQALPPGPIALSPQTRELRVRLRLLAYADPLANRYFSRLQGYDRGWLAQGGNGERIFSGLQPGAYALHLRASDAAGNPAAEQVLRWRVLPPWWRTPWALAGLLALVALALWWIAAAWRARLQQRHALRLIAHERELAEQASLAKTRFLATLGHEVRTPMTGVLGMSELLLGTGLDARQRDYTEAIRRAGNHLLRLVNDALDLARIEAGKLELAPQPFSPQALVADVVALEAPMAQRKGLRFVQQVATDVPAVLLGDALRIRQILLNLLGNAIKFTEAGEVGVRAEPLAPQGVRFVISDTGPGLDAEQQARLFRRFEQAEGPRTAARYGGSGLGLAISQELAAAMGGRIDVDSAPGAGTRFTVELPLPPAAAAAAAPVATPAAPGARPPLELLLVEDEPTVAEVLAGLLRVQGHRVVHAAHGLAALTAAAGARFDLALLDLDLPGMDGLALAQALRAQGVAMPLLAITARADAEAEPQARAAGFDGFLRKPLTGAMLAEAIEALLPLPDPA
ncbi:hybrid sensor histidine kinase/response regulator [Cognatiluteimonas weifangensis]|uniref:histidine kinase n=1 Tax=Cognatiluteimonas weifangensis TaxID=2303539 RepID=A0A372DSY7_9GAMM|nr:ATP-binding protein [Luteimonas weifangensis]RFP62577.1 hybrid sensor histidine kinase/response regulator [Luteimonas weifangensis]